MGSNGSALLDKDCLSRFEVEYLFLAAAAVVVAVACPYRFLLLVYEEFSSLNLDTGERSSRRI